MDTQNTRGNTNGRQAPDDAPVELASASGASAVAPASALNDEPGVPQTDDLLKSLSADQTPLTIAPDAPDRFFNRELSWLAFNARVLEEAMNPAHPVLERLRFLSISGSNLDEFFMVRVAGLHGQVRESVNVITQDGLTPQQQLRLIDGEAKNLMAEQQRCWRELRPQISDAGVTLVQPEDMFPQERKWLEDAFLKNIFPILTPLTLDPAHPFPFIPNLGFVLCFDLKHRNGETMTTLLPVPIKVGRFLRLPVDFSDVDNNAAVGDSRRRDVRFVSLEDTIATFLHHVFPHHEIIGKGSFRILRDSDVELEEEAEDLVRVFESMLQRRRRGDVIRIKVDARTPDHMKDLFCERLNVPPKIMVMVDGLLGLAQISGLIPKDRIDLQFAPYEPRFPERIREHGGDCFAAIRAKDILIHHPYESFDVVVQFLKQAARDPDVLAIKQTVYRTSRQSPIVDALIEAAEAGKNVTALIELKARFDEEANIQLARELERSGVSVVYGFFEYKTHAKLSYVVRQEGDDTRTYVHVGTGNYHPVTARIYTDMSLFTCDPAIARDAAKVFNYVTGYATPDHFEKFAVAPISARRKIVELIDAEIAHARAGRPAAIWAKMNSLVDGPLIDKFYEASVAGVQIDLVVRGICCLRPGVRGLSENIRVKSIIGRFLEHSRIYCFGNGKALPSDQAKIFIASADLMPRNLNRRVEVFCPIENPTVHNQILDQVMVANLNDEQQSWRLNADGSHTRVQVPDDVVGFNAHTYLMTNASLSGRGEAIRYNAPAELTPNPHIAPIDQPDLS
ncbi:MAG: RNA degradosome polyphosphate kinase [Pseudomonadota bacterium]